LHNTIRRKRSGLLSQGALLLHDSNRSHTASVTRVLVLRFRWNALEHLSYSLDLAPSDFNHFGSLKKHLQVAISETMPKFRKPSLSGSVTWSVISSMPVSLDWLPIEQMLQQP
ncbi:hypothetical protein AVEN_205835-2-1, partial [Araneus ventricosus]